MICDTIHLRERYPLLGEHGKDPILESYLPYNMTEMNRQDQKRPVMLILPGGGYGAVSQREGEPVALHLLPEGFNMFVLKYSVAPNQFPTQLIEVAAAMDMIHANGEKWNCDTSRIAIMGFSAGGHLAAHYTNSYACKEVRQVFPDSKAVNASVLCYPVITADPAFAHAGSFENLVGHFPLTDEEMLRFSCEKLISGHTPPTFLWHTAQDGCVAVNNSLLYAQRLSAFGVPFELHIFPYGDHGLATADRDTNDAVENRVCVTKYWLVHLKQWLRSIFE